MSNFAKIFDTAAGQVLVLRTHDGNQSALQHYIKPEGFGLCCMTALFSEDEEGDKTCDEVFANEVNQDYANGFAQQFLKNAAQLAVPTEPGEFELPMTETIQ